MFWTLGLAHLLGDYPLQTDRLVRAKRRWDGLLLHVAIHLLLMLLLSGRDSLVIWPQLLALAAAHYAIDTFKNYESRHWPRFVVLPYVVDQLLHILSILLVAAWIQSQYGIYRDQDWMVYAAAFLSVTHVWFITERILARCQPPYQAAVELHRWSRQLTRALLLTAFLLAGHLLRLPQLLAPFALMFTLLPPPYRASPFRRLMLAQDLLGPLVFAFLVFVFTV